LTIRRELLYFLTIAKEGNISKAAEALFVSQPTLSRYLQNLENSLGARLFKRTTDGLKATAAGEYYIKYAEFALKEHKKMETHMSRLNNLEAGRLTIGTTVFLGALTLPEILKSFHEKYPRIQVDIVEEVSLGVEYSVLKGEVDLAILHTPIVNKQIAVERLVRDEFLLVVSPDDPLNHMSYRKDDGREYIDISLLAERDFILTHPNQRTRQVTDRALGLAGIRPRVKFHTKSIQTAVWLAYSGLGITMAPSSYRAIFGSNCLPKYYYIEPKYKAYWDLMFCYLPEIPLSNGAKEMIKICKEYSPLWH